MAYHPPAGARDLLPLDVAQKHWIEDRLEQIFQRWGYHRIITSTVESLDTLMAGGAIDRATVVQLQGNGSPALGLRPELTASIARAAVTRMAQVSYPQRLYYTANVFRQDSRGSQGDQQEYYQAGVELLGIGGTWADAEVLRLLLDCLGHLKLEGGHVIVGNAGLTRSLLDCFPPAVRPLVRDAIARLDRVQLETLALSDDLRDRALTLMDLRGAPKDVLQRVSQLPLEPHQRAIVNDLKSLVDLLPDDAHHPPVILDLSLIQPFDYYTGVVFKVVADTPQGRQVVGQGGRYDNLLGVFDPQGRSYPGIGFMVSIETLHQALLTTGHLPEATPASDWLVVPTAAAAAAAAFAYARTLREGANLVRAELYLEPEANPDDIRRRAEARRIRHIAWVAEDGTPEVETVN
jgi:ATP phosphoribosyltransferase regulatory subunit